MTRKLLKPPKDAQALLDMYFLDMRCALLETAAAFDRIERAEGADAIMQDGRIEKLKQACTLIQAGEPDRAIRFLTLFSETD